jgi:hypothetical protein
MSATVARERLRRQGITTSRWRDPADVVAWFGAVQAQEFLPACWGLGLRLPETLTSAGVEAAFDAGHILRTHVLRPTWHFVTPADIRWMLALTGPHVKRRMLPYERQLELDRPLLTKAKRVFARALRDGAFLTRVELAVHLERAGIVARTNRLAHIALDAELDGLVCSGPRRGKSFTYALLDARARADAGMPRDEALAELVRRYFRSHGPATVRDFVWWSGLPTADAHRGLQIAGGTPTSIDGLTYWTVDAVALDPPPRGRVDLLPIYDEYIVAYRDRAAVPHGSAAGLPGGVTFQHALVIDGLVRGTWRVRRRPAQVIVDLFPSRRLTLAEKRSVRSAVARYGRFTGMPAILEVH